MRKILPWVGGLVGVALVGLGVLPANAIVGGQIAEEAGPNIAVNGGGCSGILLNRRWAASAAHCFENSGGRGTIEFGATARGKGTTVEITRVEREGDLALLRLATELPPNAVPFPGLADADPPVGSVVTVVGYGVDESGQGSPNLRTGTTVVAQINMRADAAGGPSWLARKTGKGDVLFGDSGGGAFLNGKLMGTVSNGDDAGANFASIAGHRSFIDSTIRN